MNLEFYFVVLTRVWVVGEILIALLTTTRPGKGNIQDRGTQIILWTVIFVSFWVNGCMHSFLPINMPGSYTWLLPLALGILVLGMTVRATAVFNLGKAFSANVSINAGQKLQRSGLYRLVRHPSYFGLELIFLGLALHSRTWACLAVVLIPPTLALMYRIHVEEKALRLAFGAEYEDYSRTTKCLIPGIY
jgi:protein-S-isoprenylcysteine O-methyltransferase Ste14